MAAKKIRVSELAKELGLTNKEALDLSVSMGVPVKAISSTMEDAQADRVRRKAERDGLKRDVQPEEEKPAKKAAAKKAPAKKAAAKPADAPSAEGDDTPAKKAPAKKAAAKKAAAKKDDAVVVEPTPEVVVQTPAAPVVDVVDTPPAPVEAPAPTETPVAPEAPRPAASGEGRVISSGRPSPTTGTPRPPINQQPSARPAPPQGRPGGTPPGM
ncbi:MAG: translation initiation factor IF-2 N-terminal domain-containing protein, partial [Acidimicrobiaceae bacterium]